MFERRLYHHIDWALVIAILALCALGVVMINSTTADPTRAASKMYITQLYAIVLGLGGWFLGILIVITTMPGTPLDDELLAAFSVGVPVGLCIYFAWLNRGWAAQTKVTGFAAAMPLPSSVSVTFGVKSMLIGV